MVDAAAARLVHPAAPHLVHGLWSVTGVVEPAQTGRPCDAPSRFLPARGLRLLRVNRVGDEIYTTVLVLVLYEHGNDCRRAVDRETYVPRSLYVNPLVWRMVLHDSRVVLR